MLHRVIEDLLEVVTGVRVVIQKAEDGKFEGHYFTAPI
jgi:hypothetical protein